MSEIQSDIGARFRMIREKLNYTQKQMAELIDGSIRAWQEYERGNQVPGGIALYKLSLQGININWLLTGEGPMRINQHSRSLPFDGELFETVMNTVEKYLERIGKKDNLSFSQKIKLGRHLYEEAFNDEGLQKEFGFEPQAERLINLMTG